ncbi:hypothetical protein [uncultured Aliiroseovarius sp.]|uniref:hypothetical protein n=1 Tax=uncultured Aliiroseovarius sp. TaxID=1658783 RepID=UPI002631D251|nr:hypothetical protein [uncultured Aliiroseovarius sp.]
MTEKPKYVLGDADRGLQIFVFDQYGSLSFDSFYVLDPSESKSKAWEVWLAEWSDPDMKRADLIRKQIEIHSDWVTTTQHVHLVCQSLEYGYDIGEFDGETRMQAINRFAHAALTGEADATELYEATHQAGFGIEEDGSNYSRKGAEK